jgi:rubrerythrin
METAEKEPIMNVEEAIKTALQYENRVVGVYVEAMRESKDPTGKKVFETLAREEKQHVLYLDEKMAELKKTGTVTATSLASVVPPRERIESSLKEAKTKVGGPVSSSELELLKRALQVEIETSGFYRKVVSELPPDGSALFERFVDIEEGHKAIVQAEIDSVTGSGYWFDMPEFNLEAG